MTKKGTPQIDFPMSDGDLRILEKRVGKAIKEKGIAGLEKQFAQSKSVKHLSFPHRWQAAALWIFLVSLPVFAFLFTGNGEKGIFNRYYAPYDFQDITGIYRGLASEMYTPYYLYSRGDFSAALPRFRQYLEVYPADNQARLLLAVCLMEGKHFSEAQSELNRIIQTGNFFFQDDARWYLALLAVREGDFETASVCLRQLGQNSRYAAEVESLQKKMAGKITD